MVVFLHSPSFKISIVFSVAKAVFLYVFVHCSFPFQTLTQVIFTVYTILSLISSQSTKDFRASFTFTSILANICVVSVSLILFFPPLSLCILSPLPMRPSSPFPTQSSHRENCLFRCLSGPVYAVLWGQMSGLSKSPTVVSLCFFYLVFLIK